MITATIIDYDKYNDEFICSVHDDRGIDYKMRVPVIFIPYIDNVIKFKDLEDKPTWLICAVFMYG